MKFVAAWIQNEKCPANGDGIGNGADKNLILITPAHAERIVPGEAGGFFGGDFS
jgi:hypothetical protein